MSDCDHCWDTPCTCKDARGYRHLSINELRDIIAGMTKLIDNKRRRGLKPDQRELPSLAQ